MPKKFLYVAKVGKGCVKSFQEILKENYACVMILFCQMEKDTKT
jgi:hypothetical protein